MNTHENLEDLINHIPQFKELISQFNQIFELIESFYKNLPAENSIQPKLIALLQQMQLIITQNMTNAINEFVNSSPELNQTQLSQDQLKHYQYVLSNILEKNYLNMLANKDFQHLLGELINNITLHYHPITNNLNKNVINNLLQPFEECTRTIIYQKDRVTLYRYSHLAPQRFRTPILIVYALVNRPTILDLQPDRSLIRQLLLAGFDIYLIDWGYPTKADKTLCLNDYLSNYLKHSIKQLCLLHHVPAITLLGVCQGGIMSICYSALFPKQVKNLITMVTPVEFHSNENILGQLLKNINISALVEKWGNIPGIYIAQSLLNLRPFRLLHEKYQSILYGTASSDELAFFRRMEYWLHDCPDHPQELFREFIQQFYQKNKLINNQLTIGKKSVNLKKITMPVFNIYARDDHLVPPSASMPLINAISSSDRQNLEFEGGHIGVFVSRKAISDIPTKIIHWLEARDV